MTNTEEVSNESLLYHGWQLPNLVLTPCSADYPVGNARRQLVWPLVHRLDGYAHQRSHFLYGPEVLN